MSDSPLIQPNTWKCIFHCLNCPSTRLKLRFIHSVSLFHLFKSMLLSIKVCLKKIFFAFLRWDSWKKNGDMGSRNKDMICSKQTLSGDKPVTSVIQPVCDSYEYIFPYHKSSRAFIICQYSLKCQYKNGSADPKATRLLNTVWTQLLRWKTQN